MNQLVKKITERVLDEVVPYTWTKLDYDEIKSIQHRTVELIVRECIGVAVDNGCGDFVDIEHVLLKHFGVEE